MISGALKTADVFSRNLPLTLWRYLVPHVRKKHDKIIPVKCVGSRDFEASDQQRPNQRSPADAKSAELLDPAGKVAIVVGGCKGVGLTIAAELLRQHVHGVIMTSCDPQDGDKAIEYLKRNLPSHRAAAAEYVELDVTDREQFEAVFQKTLFRHKRVDMLFNSGGIMDDSIWECEVDTNVYGLVRGVLLAFRYMGPRTVGLPPLEALVTDTRVADGAPIVVNMAGIAALDPLVGAPVFSLTQSAAISLTRSLGAAYHLGRTGVRVTCLCVGLTPEDALLGGSTFLQKKLIDSEWSTATQQELTAMPVQQARVVAKAALYLTRRAPGGTVWTVDDSELSQVEFPETKHICKKCMSFK